MCIGVVVIVAMVWVILHLRGLSVNVFVCVGASVAKYAIVLCQGTARTAESNPLLSKITACCTVTTSWLNGQRNEVLAHRSNKRFH